LPSCPCLFSSQTAHEKIRENPEFEPTEKQDSYEPVNPQKKLTLAERKARVAAKKATMKSLLLAADDDDDDDDEEEDDE